MPVAESFEGMGGLRSSVGLRVSGFEGRFQKLAFSI